jgi:hypothetical protein
MICVRFVLSNQCSFSQPIILEIVRKHVLIGMSVSGYAVFSSEGQMDFKFCFCLYSFLIFLYKLWSAVTL